jgi:YesN/AraC family two-component response regulator
MSHHTLMIVDDEPHVRTLLRNCIDWSELGIEIVAEAGNAEESLSLAASLAPEIVCLDICMPVMNGIKIAEEMRKIIPATEIVVISGHDDFAYAQQCIRIGIADYLLKPINEKDLRDIMEKICIRLNALGGNYGITTGGKSVATDEQSERDIGAHRQGNVAIQEIVSYITENYMLPELSLQYIARLFYLNPSYISRAFKQETGENWVEYLTKIRMEHAIQLLKSTDKRCYEISQEVGFSDAKYFSTCFKNYTGQTVNEFRKCDEIAEGKK